MQTPPKRDGHGACCLARAGRSGVPVACSSVQSGNRADFVHPQVFPRPSRKSRKSRKSLRWFCATMASWKWPLVKVAELGRTCITIQDNLPHIARPLDAVPKFQYFRCRSHFPADVVVQVQPVQRLEIAVCSILSSSNCPVLNPWGILYVQTALVLLGAYLRPRIRWRALRAPSLHPRASYFSALRAVRSH